MPISVCPNCSRQVALCGEHGCGRQTDRCGARDAQCFDCVLECCQQTISNLRGDLERYQSKFGALRPGLGKPKRRKLDRKQARTYPDRSYR